MNQTKEIFVLGFIILGHDILLCGVYHKYSKHEHQSS